MSRKGGDTVQENGQRNSRNPFMELAQASGHGCIVSVAEQAYSQACS
jgi:hypothetical protein